MKALPPQTLVDALGRRFFLGRASRFLPQRYAVLEGPKLRRALESLPDRPSAAGLARRGRLRRLLGETDAARADLDAALRLSRDLPEALAWRWELEDALSPAAPAADAPLRRAAEAEPENGWHRLWLSLALLRGGRPADALASAGEAVRLLPREAAAAAVEGLCRYESRRFKEALPSLDRALALDPALEWARRLRAICRFESGDRAGCLEDCVEAMRLDENSGLLFVMLGLYALKVDMRRNLEAATRHIEKNPRDYWAYLFRADVRRSPLIGENQGALEDLRRACELAPERGFSWAYLSRCHVTLGDFRAAGEAIERAVRLDPSCGWIRAWHGEFQRRAGDLRGAAKTLDEAVRLFPDYELAYAWRGSARRLLGKPREALADLDVAVALRPHTLDLCYFERMQTLRALGRTAEALADARRANALNPKYVWEAEPNRFSAGLAEIDAELERDPKNALAHLWRGDLMMRMRDFAAAEKDLSRAVACPDCPAEALVLRGRARCELGRWDEAFEDLDAALLREPENAFARAWRGRALMLQGRHARAVEDFSAALERERNSAWLLAWKGEAEYKLKRLKDAERSLSKAIEVHSRFAEAFAWRGAARLASKAARAAAADFDEALRLQPGIEPAKSLRAKLPAAAAADPLDPGRALQREGRHEEAAAFYGGVLARRPKDADALRLRAEAHRCMGRYDLALADHDALVRLFPGSAEALCNRVEIRRHAWDFDGGLADADRALELEPASASAWVGRAECLRSLGRYEESVRAATRAAELEPGWSWPLIVRAKALRQNGELAAALADTALAERSGPDAYALGWRAEILRKLGKVEDALEAASKACAMQPNNAWFRALRGQIRCDLGQREKGLADLTHAARLDPRCSCDYDFLGAEGPKVRSDRALDWVYAWRGGVHRAAGRLDRARADLDHAARLSPGCFWIAAWRGELLAAQGELKAGLAALRRALKACPRYAQAAVWAGQALVAAGKPKEARPYFDAALAAEPDNVFGLIGRAVCLESAGRSEEAAGLMARAQALAPALFASVSPSRAG